MKNGAAIYVRTMTPDENAQPELCRLRRIAEHGGYTVVGEYRDRGLGGSKTLYAPLNWHSSVKQ